MTHLSRSLVIGSSVVALAACGPEDLGSPGANGDINIGEIDNSITNPPASTPTPTPGAGVTPATGCPTIGVDSVVDNGTITGPTGTYRVCALPTTFTENATIPYVRGVLYALPGRVDVGSDDGPLPDASDQITGTTVTLTIQPGVIIYGATGRSYLVVQRGSRLVADGAVDRPIIFTSRDNVLGLTNETSSQQWGGVVLLGRAPVSDCSSGAPSNDRVACQQELEGALNPPSFGGPDGNDSSGSLNYVQIRYSGFTLSQGSELQSLTTGGVGNRTRISHVQSFNSSDDGVELFGGEPKLDHFIVIGAEDDSFDIDSGAKADIQYAIAVQRQGSGDNLLELDSPDADFSFDALPRTNAQITNFTFIGSGSGAQAIRARGRADLNMSNGVVVTTGNCLRVDEEDNAAAGSRPEELGPPMFNSVLFACDVAAGSAIEGYLNAGTNNVVGYTPTLTNLFVNGVNETAAAIYNATALSSFFAASTHVGAVGAGDTWYQGWTCNSATANLGGGSSCLTLPVY